MNKIIFEMKHEIDKLKNVSSNKKKITIKIFLISKNKLLR